MATALLGTDQRTCSVVSPEIEFLARRGDLDAVAEQEAWVLLAAAYAAGYRRAGQIPPVAPRPQHFAPAPAETRPYCSATVAARLAALIADVPLTELLIEEVLLALARKAKIVPPALLPELLTWSLRSKERRGLVVPVVGARGLWLASLNPAWKNLAKIDPAEMNAGERILSGQQALYDALNITDNIFSKTFSVIAGQGLDHYGRIVQRAMDKILDLSKPGGTHYADPELVRVVVAAPPPILPEMIKRIHQALARGEYTWLARLGELLELRHQMLEELAHE